MITTHEAGSDSVTTDQERHDNDRHWVDVPRDGVIQVVMTSAEADRFQRWLRDHERRLKSDEELDLAGVPVYVLARRHPEGGSDL